MNGLTSFNGSDPVANLDRYGLSTYNTVQQVTLTDPTGYTVFDSIGNEKVKLSQDALEYEGIYQPVVYWGQIDGASGTWVLTPGFTLTKLGVGDYTITHNFGTTTYDVFLTPVSGHFRGRVYFKGSTTVAISWQQTDYGSASFPVSGGGGGSVTVSGIRLGEVPVDVNFQILIVKIPQ